MYPLELLPPQSDFQGINFLRKNFHPFSGLDGGSSRHFYRRLNALKTARIESREDSKTLTVAEIGKNGVFFVKRARRFRNAGVLKTPESTRAPKMGESRNYIRKISMAKKNHFLSRISPNMKP